MSSHLHLLVPFWMTRLLRSWTRCWRTRRLERQVRRLRKLVRQQEHALATQQAFLMLLEVLEHPPSPYPSDSPTPILEQMPPELELPPPLSQREIEALRAMPMPDPLEEIEARLGLSTTPLSPQTWSD